VLCKCPAPLTSLVRLAVVPTGMCASCTCCPTACLRTGRWLSCFGRRNKSREAQILERLKVLDDIVSDGGTRCATCPSQLNKTLKSVQHEGVLVCVACSTCLRPSWHYLQSDIAVVRGLGCTAAHSWLKSSVRTGQHQQPCPCVVLSCRSPRVCVCWDSCRYLSCFRRSYRRRAVCYGGSLQLLEQVCGGFLWVCNGFTCGGLRVVGDTVLVPAMVKLP
jgi:hypothetical protein